MAFDLKGFSQKDLDSLINQAQKQKSAMNKRKPIAGVRKKLVALAKAEGYTIAELFGGAKAAEGKTRKASKTTGRKVPPKYRNPANPKETWTGRGKQPIWVREAIAGGKSLESLAI